MLETALIEDLNRLACPQEQERWRHDPRRVREALNSLRYIDQTELERYRRDDWLNREELDLIERFLRILSEQLSPIPDGTDPVDFTQADPGWQVARERACELLAALDAFVDIGIPGWGQQYIVEHSAGSEAK